LHGLAWPGLRGHQLLVTRAGAPLSVTLILSEAVVCCPIGGPQVLAGPLRHLAELAVLPNVHYSLHYLEHTFGQLSGDEPMTAAIGS
jgi:hypothetical protein